MHFEKINIFSPEVNNFCYINKRKYKLVVYYRGT